MVWCVGSSFVRRAFLYSRNRPGGKNLGLERLNVTLWWQGYGGLCLNTVLTKIRTIKQVAETPQFILLHCGANDISLVNCGAWRNLFVTVHTLILNYFPLVHIIWSQMLPRFKWKYSENVKSMNKSL